MPRKVGKEEVAVRLVLPRSVVIEIKTEALRLGVTIGDVVRQAWRDRGKGKVIFTQHSES